MSSPTDSPATAFRVTAIFTLLFYGLLLAVVGPATLVVAWLLKREYPALFSQPAVLIGSGLWGAVALGIALTSGWYFEQVLFAWLATLPAVPAVGLLMNGFGHFIEFMRPKSPQEKLQAALRHQAKHEKKLVQQSRQRPQVTTESGKIRLGRLVKGDEETPYGIEKKQGWLLLDEDLLNTHMFVLGATGAGKTETLKRIIYEVLVNTDRDIFFIDGKGDLEIAASIQAMAYQQGRGIAPIFKMGHRSRGALYNGFVGSAEDIYNRIVALIGLDQAQGNATYFADIGKEILQLVCFAPSGPPRSFDELLARLNIRWLQRAYRQTPHELEVINSYAEDGMKELQGLAVRVRAIGRVLRPYVSPSGFAFEETRVAIFSLRTSSVKDMAKGLFNFMFEDLKDFMGKRQPRPGLIIVDEFGQFPSHAITPLLSLGRSSRQGVILATQDTSTLGEYKQEILANTTTQLMMRTDFPEDLGLMAGTIQQLEGSTQLMENEETGMGSVRPQHAHKIDMNNPPKLEPGQGYLIRQRHVYKIQTDMIPPIPAIPSEAFPQPEPEPKVIVKRTVAVQQAFAEAVPEEPEAEQGNEPTGLGLEDFIDG